MSPRVHVGNQSTPCDHFVLLEWADSAEASPWLVARAQREAGLDLFTQARNAALTERFSLSALTIVDPEFAMEKARNGDLDGAIEMVRAVVDGAYESGDMIWRGRATNVPVELLVRRGSAGDQRQAQAAIDRLAAVPTDPGFVLHEPPLLRSRALLAHTRSDDSSFREFMGRYRSTAAAAGFKTLLAQEEATTMPPQGRSETHPPGRLTNPWTN